MKLKLPPQQNWYRDGDEIVTPAHDGHGVFVMPVERLARFGDIVRQNPKMEVLSEEPHWFRLPQGTTGISVAQQQFTADDDRYFEASVSLAPAVLLVQGVDWVGRRRPVSHKPTLRRKSSRERSFWRDARETALKWLRENGAPEQRDGGQGRLEKYVADWLAKRGQHPAESTVRVHVRQWIGEYRENPLTS